MAKILAAILLFSTGAYAQVPFWGDQGDGTFKNPVLWADYNNLDVIRQGSDFYMTAATHHFMGMPVLHSNGHGELDDRFADLPAIGPEREL